MQKRDSGMHGICIIELNFYCGLSVFLCLCVSLYVCLSVSVYLSHSYHVCMR